MFPKKFTSAQQPPAAASDRGHDAPPLPAPPYLTLAGNPARPERSTPLRGAVPIARAAGDDVSPVLDALGGMLSSYGRLAFDMPDRSAADVAVEFARWHRHATLGVPASPGESASAVGIADRDWEGVLRAFNEQRREEHRYVSPAVTELRDALWACVQTVHNAVRIDQKTDASADIQMERARTAINRLQTGSIKEEVLSAVACIAEALQSRRTQLELQYGSLATKLDHLGAQLEEAKRESTTDPLTGLGNRKTFDIAAERAVHLHALGRTPVTLVLIDLDRLKFVNDMYGHQAGDAFITGVSRAMSKVFVRQSDIVCRHGGDEFAAILNNTDSRIALTLVRRLHDLIAAMPAPHPSLEFRVGASMGLAQLHAREDASEWIARADKALYRAKQGEPMAVAESPESNAG